MMALTVTADHRGNRPQFPGKPLVGKAATAGAPGFRHWPEAGGFDGIHLNHLNRYHRLEATKPS
jgi:hypothetical protein